MSEKKKKEKLERELLAHTRKAFAERLRHAKKSAKEYAAEVTRDGVYHVDTGERTKHGLRMIQLCAQLWPHVK